MATVGPASVGPAFVAPGRAAPASVAPLPAAESTLVVIANPDVGVDADDVSTSELRRIFMLRRRFWPDGRRIAPVNLPATDSLRIRFSRAVLGQTPRQMVDYWNDLYFHGVEPPPVLESQRAVQLYVARTPGAVGYVDAAALDPSLGSVLVLRELRK